MAQQFSIFWITPLNCGWQNRYIIGKFFSSGGATLYKNTSDQTVTSAMPVWKNRIWFFFIRPHFKRGTSSSTICGQMKRVRTTLLFHDYSQSQKRRTFFCSMFLRFYHIKKGIFGLVPYLFLCNVDCRDICYIQYITV